VNEEAVKDFAAQNGLRISEFHKISPTIEDAFIKFLS
jgi:hypothetical protein